MRALAYSKDSRTLAARKYLARRLSDHLDFVYNGNLRHTPSGTGERKPKRSNRRIHTSGQGRRLGQYPPPASPLMSLPPELRLMILEFAMWTPKRMFLNNLRAPAITQVSRQLRAESLSMFLRINKFYVFFSDLGRNEGDNARYGIDYAPHTRPWIESLERTTPLFHDIYYELQPEHVRDDVAKLPFFEDFRLFHSRKRSTFTHGGMCPFCCAALRKLPYPCAVNLNHPVITQKWRDLLMAYKLRHDENITVHRDMHFRELRDDNNNNNNNNNRNNVDVPMTAIKLRPRPRTTALSLYTLTVAAQSYLRPSRTYVENQESDRLIIDNLMQAIEGHDAPRSTSLERRGWIQRADLYADGITKYWMKKNPGFLKK